MCIITAWQHISPEETVNSFKNCCMSNGMDGTDDDMIWNESEEDGNVSNGCDKDEGTDCEDGDSDTDW
jgi:hypothetical protein